MPTPTAVSRSALASVVGTAVSIVLATAAPVFADPATQPAVPPRFEVLCTPTDPGLAELSGLVVGDGVLYGMADSGADERLAVLDDRCAVTRWIPNPVDPFDVEDLQMFDGQLWLADTGDNRRVRDTIALTTLRPDVGGGELHRLTYPDGAHDAEALLIDASGRPIVVTKESTGTGGVYRPVNAQTVTDLASPGPTPLERVGQVAFSGLVTGGAVSADGTVAVLRTYNDAYLYYAADGDIAAALTSQPGYRISLPLQPQGEAVAFDPAGNLVIGSEALGTILQPLQILRGATELVRPAPERTEPAAAERNSAKIWWIGGAAAVVVAAAAALGWRVFR